MKFNPAIADKDKWQKKSTRCMEEDSSRMKGILVGYSMCFFDPSATHPDDLWKFVIRTAYSREHMDPEQAERLQAALMYIMAGVQKIFNVDIEELRKMMEDHPNDMKNYVAKGSLN